GFLSYVGITSPGACNTESALSCRDPRNGNERRFTKSALNPPRRNMEDPKATLEDLYRQNDNNIALLDRLNENSHYIREATYGQTVAEAGKRFDLPKHGEFGAVGENSAQAESLLGEFLTAIG